MSWKNYLRGRTQNPRFLWRMVIAILFTGLAAGFAAQFIPKSEASPSDSLIDTVTWARIAAEDGDLSTLLDSNTSFEDILMRVAFLNSGDPDAHRQAVQSSKLEPEHQRIVVELIQSVAGEEISTQLVKWADAEPRLRFANHAIGAYQVGQRSFGAAAQRFEREGEWPDANTSRKFALEAYQAANDAEAIERLAEVIDYQSLITPRDELMIAEQRRDWPTIFWTIPKLVLARFGLGAATVLAILAGVGWFAIALQLGQPKTQHGVRWWLCLLGVGTGFLSIWATHLINVWQELDWGITESDELIDGIKFYVLGVGLREEFAKFLALLPLMPTIIRRKSRLEALVVSACVGLGFAIIENMGYFARSGGLISMGRFLTANFAHMSMTGLIGLAFARAFWLKDAASALSVFLIVVLSHGLYDATIAVPALAEYSIVGMIIFILLSYQFFHEVRSLYTQRPETVSMTATFLFVVCVLTTITVTYASYAVGFVPALTLLVTDIGSLGLMVYMYLREMPNSLVRD
ncbi:MAG: PrsW family glutamic-type intramembrane protease [Rubripirellula sp.]